MRRVANMLAALTVSAVPVAAQQATPTAFVDDFDRLNEARWYISDGWVNGDHQNCMWSKRAVTVSGGTLRIAFSKTSTKLRPYACGEVQTHATMGFGTYEVRLRTPKGSGLNANFFTYIGAVHKQPHDEVDFEFLLKDTSHVQLNSFVSGKGGNEHFVDLANASDAKFTDYAMIQEPGRLRWFIDGTLVHEITDAAKVPSHPAKIYLSLWGSDTLNDWMGPFRDPGAALTMEVDRVAFTPLRAPCQFEASLACDEDLF